jgi:hypothetical protein
LTVVAPVNVFNVPVARMALPGPSFTKLPTPVMFTLARVPVPGPLISSAPPRRLTEELARTLLVPLTTSRPLLMVVVPE